jgi:large subunit ribosomal protein L29
MKAAKLRELSPQELRQQCEEMRRELFNLRVRHASGQPVEQPSRLRALRRDIARAQTLQGERARREAGAT